MSKLVLYHGSDHIVGQPVFGKGKPDNDYGTGFYCTESIELAKEWACGERGQDGYANAYTIDTDGLNILNLSDEKYNILNWLAILIKNRRFSTTVPIAQVAKQYIVENFSVDIAPYDIIIGYRADDSYFSFAKDFISNTISLEQLSRAMRLGKLGEQVVLKSKKAFDAVQFERDKCEYADSSIYFPLREKRDSEARTQYLSVERYNDVVNGLFIRDIMGRNMKNEDFSR